AGSAAQRAGLFGAGGQLVLGRVVHAFQHQPLGRGEPDPLVPGRLGEPGRQPSGFSAPFADVYASADQCAHHVVAEGVGCDLGGDHAVVAAVDGEGVQVPDGGGVL